MEQAEISKGKPKKLSQPDLLATLFALSFLAKAINWNGKITSRG
jgi:hypothetical protein